MDGFLSGWYFMLLWPLNVSASEPWNTGLGLKWSVHKCVCAVDSSSHVEPCFVLLQCVGVVCLVDELWDVVEQHQLAGSLRSPRDSICSMYPQCSTIKSGHFPDTQTKSCPYKKVPMILVPVDKQLQNNSHPDKKPLTEVQCRFPFVRTKSLAAFCLGGFVSDIPTLPTRPHSSGAPLLDLSPPTPPMVAVGEVYPVTTYYLFIPNYLPC